MQLHYAEEVRDALAEGRPVVALESTVISHGLPFPHNAEIAANMQSAIRAEGAVPATIAVLGGKIHVGLSDEQIHHLATAPDIRKCSRRDFSIAVGLKQDAATTVAGTMIVAHQAGIRVFATGGIGGVHRGHPFDVSADLIELGRTPVAVVCAGAKSILDLPLTLEVLETQGVPVLAYGADTFPSFYTRESGLAVDERIDTPQQAADIIHASLSLGLGHGVLIAVPVAPEYEMHAAQAEEAIQQAVAEADAQGIHGKDVTPFILSRMGELTDGQARATNTALLQNNARIGGQIAVALSARDA
ncbi:MAG: pseudouridine-5'-phosphate glycosidase [Anaerolineaceae bacterium]|nr:MAG: pseudouridine-5'-phosphate glycosidase [Anaerolineaceae bacterium]